MNNAEFERPIPKALGDLALEAALEEAKKSPDGLLAAMILLEQQEQLRREDELALQAWQNDHRASFAPEAPAQPQGDEPLSQSSSPEEITDPFDQLLSRVEEDESSGVDFEEINPAELTVTTTLNQIISDVDDSFAAIPAEEAVTDLEESEALADLPAPVVAESVSQVSTAVNPSNSAGKVRFNFQTLAAPIVVAALFTSLESSMASVLIGLLVGVALSSLAKLAAVRSEGRSNQSHQIMTRATFGVWGAILPQVGLTAVRLGALGLASLFVARRFFELVSGGLANQSTGWSDIVVWLPAAIAAVLVLASISPLAKWLSVVLAPAATALLVFPSLTAFATANALPVDGAEIATVAISYFVLDSMLIAPGRSLASESNSSATSTLQIFVKHALPALAVSVLGSMAFSVAVRTDVRSIATLLCAAASVLAIASLISALIARLVEDLHALHLSKVFASLLLLATALASALFLAPWLERNGIVEVWLPAIFGLVIAAQVPYLVESFLRRGDFHEVSLQRGYAFYRRFAVAALVGYLLVVGLGYALSIGGPIGSGESGLTLVLFAGKATVPMLLILCSALFTLATSWIRIRYQQDEIRNIEQRRNELSGFDVFN